jgi:hypothetical membrane protein
MGGRVATRWLLTSGVIGPVLFVIVMLIEGWTRPGYDPVRMYVSLLSLGDQGWQQVTNFVVNGTLIIAGAVGLKRALTDGPGSRWGPILIGVAGAALVVGGLFVTDPSHGYPPGVPAADPANPSTSGLVHDLAALTTFLAIASSAFVMARRFRHEQSRWAPYARLSGLGVLVFLAAVFVGTDITGVLQRIAAVIALGWVAQLMWRYRTETATS